MATNLDFLAFLDNDTSLKIFMCLDDPADLVRISCVSRSWRQFAVVNSLSKHQCWKLFPPSRRFDCVMETTTSSKSRSNKSFESDNLEKEHRAYAFLSRGCVSFPFRGLISDAISASSTDNYPDETVRNTLEQIQRVERRGSYWSSRGQSDPSVPEILIYKLVSKICVITEISVRPFEAFFQWGSPIYAAKAVRFRVGHLKDPNSDLNHEPSDNLADDIFSWTYTSPMFPMAQVNTLQHFKLPEPVLCLGGYLQVELLGRVQRQEMDGLYYICVCYVEAMGRSLSPAFDMDVVESSGKIVLNARSYCHPASLEPESCPSHDEPMPPANGGHNYGENAIFHVRQLDALLNMLRGDVEVQGFGWMNGGADNEFE